VEARVILKLFRRKSESDVQIEQALAKTRQRGVFSEITRLFDRGALDEELYEELEMLLIQADVGVEISDQLVSELRERVNRDRIQLPAEGRGSLREARFEVGALGGR
jgi:fused signal recognition particle receptor